MIRGWNLGRGTRFIFFGIFSWALGPPNLLFNWHGYSFPAVNSRGVKLTAHLQLVPRFKNECNRTCTSAASASLHGVVTGILPLGGGGVVMGENEPHCLLKNTHVSYLVGPRFQYQSGRQLPDFFFLVFLATSSQIQEESLKLVHDLFPSTRFTLLVPTSTP
jgi:hypothetical protein